MKIHYHKNFLKNYRQRIIPHPNLDKKFKQKFTIFSHDPTNPILKNHHLIGDKSEYSAFSITGDIRVVYKKVGEDILLYDIGSHNQVY